MCWYCKGEFSKPCQIADDEELYHKLCKKGERMWDKHNSEFQKAYKEECRKLQTSFLSPLHYEPFWRRQFKEFRLARKIVKSFVFR